MGDPGGSRESEQKPGASPAKQGESGKRRLKGSFVGYPRLPDSSQLLAVGAWGYPFHCEPRRERRFMDREPDMDKGHIHVGY